MKKVLSLVLALAMLFSFASFASADAKEEMTLKIMQEKNGDETTATYQLKLPYKMDGVVVNLPGYLAGLPEEAWLSEFVSLIPEPSAEDEEVPGADEFDLGEDF